MDYSAISLSDPRLFVRATALIVIALVAHACRLYGWKRGVGIVLAILTVAGSKELVPNAWPYVASPAISPGGLPVGVIAGWLIVGLLALEWGRWMSLLRRTSKRGRLADRLVWAAIFGAAAGNALEPIGQAVGWWRWPGEAFPCLADGSWAGVTGILVGSALLVASGPRAPSTARTFRNVAVLALVLAALALGAGAVLASVGFTALAPSPRNFLGFLAMGLLAGAMVKSRAFVLEPLALRPAGAWRMGAAHAIPSICTWTIIWVLVCYAVPTRYAGFSLHCIPLAALRLATDLYWVHRWARATAPRRARARRRPVVVEPIAVA